MIGRRERFVLKAEHLRRARGTAAVALAGFGIFGLLVAVGVLRFDGGLAPPPELLRPFAVVLAVLLLVLGAGLRIRLRPRHFVSVDVEAGTATFVVGGAVKRQVPIDQIGPLRHAVEKRRVSVGEADQIVTYHVARSEPFPELRFFESEDELATRRALESRARAWRVPYVKPTGERRSAEELGAPLFQRLESNEAVTKSLPQRPGSHLEVAWKDGGYEISTSYRPSIDRTKLLLALGAPPVLVGWFLREPILDAFRPGTPAPLRVLAAVLAGASFVPGLLFAGRAWRRSGRPPVIRISPEGVRFRGSTLPLWSIEEVDRVPGSVARLVSDDRVLEIDADFCEPSEYEWLRHEIRRLVVEVGTRSPAS